MRERRNDVNWPAQLHLHSHSVDYVESRSLRCTLDVASVGLCLTHRGTLRETTRCQGYSKCSQDVTESKLAKCG
jgi:hypothetical protein